MKINNSFSKNVGNIYQKQQNNIPNRKKETLNNTIKKDSLELSSEAKKIKELVSKVKEMPDVRKEKIEDLKARIKSNNYNIPLEEVALKMLSKNRI